MKLRFEKKRIKDLRLQNGLTQSEFARRLETARQKIAMWEAGECKPQVASILRICEVFDVELEHFFVEENVCVHTCEKREVVK